jgi:outer membrane protein assembly factor BamB
MLFSRGRIVALGLAGLTACSEAVSNQQPKPSAPSAAAATDWPIFRGDPALTGVASGSLSNRLELAWSFATGEAITSSPVVADDTVFVGSNDNSVYAIDLAGNKKWAFATEDLVEAPPLVLDGRVHVGSSDGLFYTLDAGTGDLLWKAETHDKILGSANYVRGKDGVTRVLVGSYDTRLYGFDAKTGQRLWDYETANYVNGTPAVFSDAAVFGGCDAILHVV